MQSGEFSARNAITTPRLNNRLPVEGQCPLIYDACIAEAIGIRKGNDEDASHDTTGHWVDLGGRARSCLRRWQQQHANVHAGQARSDRHAPGEEREVLAGQAHNSYGLGASSFITKPVSFAGLVDVMRGLGKYWLEIVELPRGDGG